MQYTIGELAKLLGVSTSTLRYYDKEGLLPFLERSSNGRRTFDDRDYQWLQIIRCLKKTGMQLKDIRTFLSMTLQGDDTIDARLDLMLQQRSIVMQQITELQNTLDLLNFKCWYYETAKQAGTTNIFHHITPKDIPEQYQEMIQSLNSSD